MLELVEVDVDVKFWSYSSVVATLTESFAPPKLNPDVVAPEPPTAHRAVFKVALDVQEVPL